MAKRYGNRRDRIRWAEGLEARRLLAGQTFAGELTVVGDQPTAVVSADFNQDGKLDLATANRNAAGPIGVLLGNGDATFTAAPAPSTGSLPTDIAAGDVNGDGKIDLVTANGAANSVSVLLGNGDGTFAAATQFAVGGVDAVSVAVADFNNDGHADVAAGSDNNSTTAAGTVSVLLANGDGTLAAPSTIDVATRLRGLTAGDLNGDNRADLAVAGLSLSVLLAAGDGTFAVTNLASASQLTTIAFGDFNSDGKTDLAANTTAGAAAVRLGNGDGTFSTATTYSFGSTTTSLAAADFNGDGRLDLAAPSSNSNGRVVVLPGTGTGTFAAAVNHSLYAVPQGIAAGDFNGDGRADVATTFPALDSVTVLLGRSTGTPLSANRSYTIGQSTYDITFADFNGDDIVDMAAATLGSGSVSVLLGLGDGTFGPATVVASAPRTTSVATGDFNRDGRADLAVGSLTAPNGAGAVILLRGNGNGTFTNTGSIALSVSSDAVAVDDFNNDGRDDLAVAIGGPKGVAVLLGNGDGTFGAAARFDVAYAPYNIVTADFNGDGKADIAVSHEGASSVSVLLNLGNGVFGPGRLINANGAPTSLAVGDFDRDGRPDLAVSNDGELLGGTVTVLRNTGNGTFARGPVLPTGLHTADVAVGDFNGDHFLDVAGGNVGDSTLSVIAGRGDGTFSATRTYVVSPGPVGVFAADLNADGKTDLVSSNGILGTANALTVLLNQSPYQYVGIAGDVVTIFGTTVPISVTLSGGALAINTPAGVVAVTAANVGQIVLNGTSVTFASDLGLGATNGRIGLTVKASATATFTTTQHLATLTVNGTATLTPGGGKVLRTTGLAFGPAGRLDLADNAMVYDYKGAAPQAGVVGQAIRTARAGGGWTGAGLTSSIARADASRSTALGYLESSDYQSVYGTNGLFAGEFVDSTAVLVRYTLYGDADLDRGVSVYDFNRVGASFGSAPGHTWFTGDFDYDNGVSINDFNLLSTNFGRMLPAAPVMATVKKGVAPAKW